MTRSNAATLLAVDVTTTELALAVRSADGHEDYAATAMRGGGYWRDDPAFPCFDLAEVPLMVAELLGRLQQRGWSFDANGMAEPPAVSVSCRQHDQVLLDGDNRPLMPALSWQCNAATQEVRELKELGVEETVGTIEPRFVLPKLRCVLRHEPSLADRIATAFMTGDWIAYALTNERTLSTSDALSNGLLRQQDRQLAVEVIERAGLRPEWFPKPVQSGCEVGVVQGPVEKGDPWAPVKEVLAGWRFVAGLGDNHASAVGCGMTDDYKTLVVSAGTSGTINLSCPADAELQRGGGALKFEFYADSLLLLLMLGDCGAWYNRFLDQFAPGYRGNLDDLNACALREDVAVIERVLHDDQRHQERFGPRWANASLGSKVASTQFSIALELLLRVQKMLEEVGPQRASEVERYVLTGGLSQSPFLQYVFHAGIHVLAPGKSVMLSGRTGPLRYKTSAYGALVNAELPRFGGSLSALHAGGDRFPLKDCAEANFALRQSLAYLLRSCGLG